MEERHPLGALSPPRQALARAPSKSSQLDQVVEPLDLTRGAPTASAAAALPVAGVVVVASASEATSAAPQASVPADVQVQAVGSLSQSPASDVPKELTPQPPSGVSADLSSGRQNPNGNNNNNNNNKINPPPLFSSSSSTTRSGSSRSIRALGSAIAKATSSSNLLLSAISRPASLRKIYVDNNNNNNNKDQAVDKQEDPTNALQAKTEQASETAHGSARKPSQVAVEPADSSTAVPPAAAVTLAVEAPATGTLEITSTLTPPLGVIELHALEDELMRFENEIKTRYPDFLGQQRPPDHDLMTIRAWPAYTSIHRLERDILCDGSNNLDHQQEAKFPVNWNDDRLATFDNSLNILPCQDTGLFRGQVVPSSSCSSASASTSTTTKTNATPNAFVPDGFGMCVFPSGKRCSGKWSNGKQSGFGVVKEAAFGYEGQFHDGQAHGYGVGWYAFGQAFFGTWADGVPSGLGKLLDFRGASQANPGASSVAGTHAITSEEGWFYKNKQLQKLVCTNVVVAGRPVATSGDSALSVVKLKFPPQFAFQPLRGLYIACIALETSRLKQFAKVFDTWRTLCCDLVVELALKSRLAALVNWNHARIAQERALLDASKRMVASRKTEDGLLARTQDARAAHERTLAIKHKFQSRADHAVFMQRVIQQCDQAETRNAETMQQELESLQALLDDAKMAKKQFLKLNDQYNSRKHQVDDVALQINKIKHAIQCLEQGECELVFQDDEPLRRIITPSSANDPTMATLFVDNDNEMARSAPWPHHHGFGTARPGFGSPDLTLGQDVAAPSVCDVEGCACGIPRDVFLRVNACLRGDD